MLDDFEAFSFGLVVQPCNALHQGEVDEEGLAVLEVPVAQVVNQSQAELLLPLHRLVVAEEKQQAEVEVDEVGLLRQVLFDMGKSLLQIPYPK